MLLDQLVKNRNRVTLSPVEQGLRSGNQIRQAQAQQPIARRRLQ
jgi:UDP-N-acetylglucosamine transferase subunit ALG13